VKVHPLPNPELPEIVKLPVVVIRPGVTALAVIAVPIPIANVVALISNVSRFIVPLEAATETVVPRILPVKVVVLVRGELKTTMPKLMNPPEPTPRASMLLSLPINETVLAALSKLRRPADSESVKSPANSTSALTSIV